MGKQKAEIVIPPGQIWPLTPWGKQMQIEVFGATGEFSTGKTILGLSIAPGVHPAGHAFEGKPRTLYLDLEKSGTSYSGTGCQRVDVPAVLAQAFGQGYTAKQAAEWFNQIPSRVQPGQYDVCVVDPINDIESGQVDLVKANPGQFGYTKNQLDNSTALLMAAMKAHYKKLLMGFATAFKCLFFTTHLRDEFKGGKPTSKREPRGKETLAELASLYLWLEREQSEGSKPSAIVLKHRLSDTRVNEAGELEVIELLPRRMPVATVQEIRRYIADPAGARKPKDGEIVVEKPVTEIELQTVRLHVAEAEAAAATARANLLDRQKELAALRQAPVVAQQTIPAQPTNPTSAVQHPPKPAGITPQQMKELGSIISELFTAKTEAVKWLADRYGSGDPSTFTEPQAAGVLSSLFKLKSDRQQAALKQPAPATPEQGGPVMQPGNGKANGSGAKLDRVAQFKALLPASGIDVAKLQQAMQQKGASRFTELSEENQDALLAVLEKAVNQKSKN